jgi:hypothetical protein
MKERKSGKAFFGVFRGGDAIFAVPHCQRVAGSKDVSPWGHVFMKLLPALISLLLVVALSSPANAARKKRHHAAPAATTSQPVANEPVENEPMESQPGEKHPAATEPAATEGDSAPPALAAGHSVGAPAAQTSKSPALDFDFFGGQAGDGKTGANAAEDEERAAAARTRRWMLTTHQILGVATWLSLAGTVVIGQLNYNELWGGGGGKNTWQTPHRALVITTSALFAATGAFAIFAPTPYKKPLHFDTGLVHRIAVIGATLGMVTEGVLGWITTHQADAGNPHNARTMAQIHQIVGYTTLGFLTVAGTVWLF